MSFRPESVVKKVQRRVRNIVTPTGANYLLSAAQSEPAQRRYKKGSSQKLRDKAAQVVKKKRAKGLVGKGGMPRTIVSRSLWEKSARN